jgi:GTP 3',8-cyclase
MLEDSYGRKIDYLRLSLTEKCNLKCRYCMPSGDVPSLSSHKTLSHKEMIKLAGIFSELGIKKIRLTGGEPLLYVKIIPLIRSIRRLKGIESISLTTNGILLDKYLKELKDLGIDSINISLDSLSPAKYKKITGRDDSAKVFKNITMAIDAGLKMVKINSVLSPFIDKEDILGLINAFEDLPVVLRFIEMMPASSLEGIECQGPSAESHSYDIASLEHLVSSLKGYRPTKKVYGYGPARYYSSEAKPLVIGLINNKEEVCFFCNRLRLTSSGKMILCIFSGKSLDLKESLRQNNSREFIAKMITSFIKEKPKNRTIASEGAYENCLNECMYRVGG